MRDASILPASIPTGWDKHKCASSQTMDSVTECCTIQLIQGCTTAHGLQRWPCLVCSDVQLTLARWCTSLQKAVHQGEELLHDCILAHVIIATFDKLPVLPAAAVMAEHHLGLVDAPNKRYSVPKAWHAEQYMWLSCMLLWINFIVRFPQAGSSIGAWHVLTQLKERCEQYAGLTCEVRQGSICC